MSQFIVKRLAIPNPVGFLFILFSIVILKIENFSAKLDRLEEGAEIDLEERRDFGMILHNTKIYLVMSIRIRNESAKLSRKKGWIP